MCSLPERFDSTPQTTTVRQSSSYRYTNQPGRRLLRVRVRHERGVCAGVEVSHSDHRLSNVSALHHRHKRLGWSKPIRDRLLHNQVPTGDERANAFHGLLEELLRRNKQSEQTVQTDSHSRQKNYLAGRQEGIAGDFKQPPTTTQSLRGRRTHTHARTHLWVVDNRKSFSLHVTAL